MSRTSSSKARLAFAGIVLLCSLVLALTKTGPRTHQAARATGAARLEQLPKDGNNGE